MKRLLTTGILAACAVMTACVSLSGGGSGAERIVVQAATLHLIESAAQPAEKAQKINEAVALVKTYLADDATTVNTLRSALLERVAERDLAPSEKLVAMEVIARISDEVEARVGSGILSPDAIVTVNTVLGWILDATTFYVPVAP